MQNVVCGALASGFNVKLISVYRFKNISINLYIKGHNIAIKVYLTENLHLIIKAITFFNFDIYVYVYMTGLRREKYIRRISRCGARCITAKKYNNILPIKIA